MKNATAIPPASLTFDAALETPAQVRGGYTVVLPNRHEAERRWCGIEGRGARRREIQSVWFEMLTIAGVGILVYSVAMLLYLTC
ncbi:MAG: hypothetical protein JOY92_01245 [Verrucomicrobia bacterium]|nr:hypothetical protein [Verrucomicrobiota bacterium]